MSITLNVLNSLSLYVFAVVGASRVFGIPPVYYWRKGHRCQCCKGVGWVKQGDKSCITAITYRHARDRWIADIKAAKTLAEMDEAAVTALDDVYAWLLAHDMIEMDADAAAYYKERT